MAALLDVTLPKGDPPTVHAAKARERHHPLPVGTPEGLIEEPQTVTQLAQRNLPD